MKIGTDELATAFGKLYAQKKIGKAVKNKRPKLEAVISPIVMALTEMNPDFNNVLFLNLCYQGASDEENHQDRREEHFHAMQENDR